MELTWKRNKLLGVPTHITETTVNGRVYRAVIDRPYRGMWIVRIWGPGSPFVARYRETQTLAAAKDLVTAYMGEVAR